MPRRREVPKRKILPDARHRDRLLAKFINAVMRDGKKSTAEGIVYNALDLLAERQNTDEPLRVFKKAVDTVRPSVEVKSRRVGGATYQVPVDVPSHRRIALAMRWIIESARGRNEKTMPQRLAAELWDASNGRGGASDKQRNTHRMAEANKAFAHYRW